MAISVEEARAMTEEQLQETITEIAFEIIANVGTARGMYIEAIQEAKAGHFDQAEQLMKDGKEAFVQGHHGLEGLGAVLFKTAAPELLQLGLAFCHDRVRNFLVGGQLPVQQGLGLSGRDALVHAELPEIVSDSLVHLDAVGIFQFHVLGFERGRVAQTALKRLDGILFARHVLELVGPGGGKGASPVFGMMLGGASLRRTRSRFAGKRGFRLAPLRGRRASLRGFSAFRGRRAGGDVFRHGFPP